MQNNNKNAHFKCFYAICVTNRGGGGSDFAARRSPRPIVSHKKILTNCVPLALQSAKIELCHLPGHRTPPYRL